MAWFADIHQKFETLCSEVNSVTQEEAVKYIDNQLQTVGDNIENRLQKVADNIENQLQTMGGNIKRFSGFVLDLLSEDLPESVEGESPEFSSKQNENIDLTADESSMVDVDIEPKKQLCNKISVGPLSSLELMETEHCDSLLEQKADTGMCEKLNLSVLENAIGEKLVPNEIPEVVDSSEEDSSMASLSCEVVKSNDEGKDGQVNFSKPVSVDGFKSYVKEGETSELGNATSDDSNAVVPLHNSVILIESSQCRLSNTRLTSSDSFSAVSNEFCQAGFELSKEVGESEDYVSVAYSVAERSGDLIAEKSTDGCVIELGMETAQLIETKFDENCMVVDSNKVCAVCLTAAKRQSHKMKTCVACSRKMKSAKEQKSWQQAPGNEGLDARLNQQKGEFLANLESCDSDWEII